MPEEVVCNVCGIAYSDDDSIQMVKKWLEKDGYAPCPNIMCPGQLEIKDSLIARPVSLGEWKAMRDRRGKVER